MDKKLILKEIKRAYRIESDAAFARMLGISPQTLSSWYRRNMFDLDILSAKCVDVNPEFIVTGNGPVLRNGTNSINVGDYNQNSGNVTNVDSRLIAIIEENQQERLKLLTIIENLTR